MTIQTPWKKALVAAGVAVVAGITMPALSQARTHYTGKTPPIAMMATPFEPMEPAIKHSSTVSKKHKVTTTSAKKKLSKKKKLSTAALKHKTKAKKKA